MEEDNDPTILLHFPDNMMIIDVGELIRDESQTVTTLNQRRKNQSLNQSELKVKKCTI
jgi:hypothetical protein